MILIRLVVELHPDSNNMYPVWNMQPARLSCLKAINTIRKTSGRFRQTGSADTSFSMYSTGIFWKEIRFRSLSQPRMAMVSRSFAEKMGGIDKAVGQVLYNEDALAGNLRSVVFMKFPRKMEA